MKFENMAPGGSSNTAFEESCAIPAMVNGYTDLVLKHSGAIARVLNERRIAEGRESLAKRFTTNDNPEGFFLRVTERQAMWIVPTWAPYQAFEAAEVSFCRSDAPLTAARGF